MMFKPQKTPSQRQRSMFAQQESTMKRYYDWDDGAKEDTDTICYDQSLLYGGG